MLLCTSTVFGCLLLIGISNLGQVCKVENNIPVVYYVEQMVSKLFWQAESEQKYRKSNFTQLVYGTILRAIVLTVPKIGSAKTTIVCIQHKIALMPFCGNWY